MIIWPQPPQLPEHLQHISHALANERGPQDTRAIRIATKFFDDDDEQYEAFNAIFNYLSARWFNVKPQAYAQAYAQAHPQANGVVTVIFRTSNTRGYRTRPYSEQHYTIRNGRAAKRGSTKRPQNKPHLAIIDIRPIQFAYSDEPTIFLPGIIQSIAA